MDAKQKKQALEAIIELLRSANDDLMKEVIQELKKTGWLNDGTMIGANLSGYDEQSELGQINLSGVDLQGVNLRKTNLSGVNLQSANLRGADLKYAIFHETNLSGTNLDNADLRKADLKYANLSGASLKNARLNSAILGEDMGILKIKFGANLTNADFQGANLRGANLQGLDLSTANLSKANLQGVDLSTVDLSKGNLQEANLRGVTLSGNTLVSNANLEKSDLSESKLDFVDFGNANLRGANLSSSIMVGANLALANLSSANLKNANLSAADLSGITGNNADFRNVTMIRADLTGANLTEADFTNADITGNVLNHTNFTRASLVGTRIFGISAWEVILDEAIQSDLVITNTQENIITVDNLEVAQFIYLLLNNKKIRTIIDTITSKTILILGRFIDERKAALDAIREELRKYNYTPILFDFEKPINRNLTETVITLAGMSRFVIADLSDPNSIPYELMSFVRELRAVPVQSIFSPVPEHKNEFSMFKDLLDLNHVLPIVKYESQEHLISILHEKIIRPAEEKANEIQEKRRKLESGLL